MQYVKQDCTTEGAAAAAVAVVEAVAIAAVAAVAAVATAKKQMGDASWVVVMS